MDRDEFTTELHRVVARARGAGVALDGAYDVRAPRRDTPDYTVEIISITKQTVGSERDRRSRGLIADR